MVEPLENLPDFPDDNAIVSVLFASSDECDHARLEAIFKKSRWRLFGARNCSEARALLSKRLVSVIIADPSLVDGNWQDLLEAARSLRDMPPLIVASQDYAFWGEALNLGAYDVLAKPFDRVEVTRTVSLAWLSWKERTARKPGEAGPLKAGGPPRDF